MHVIVTIANWVSKIERYFLLFTVILYCATTGVLSIEAIGKSTVNQPMIYKAQAYFNDMDNASIIK